MSKDVGDLLRDAVTDAAREARESLGDSSPTKSSSNARTNGSKRCSGVRGLAAGAGRAAPAPLAKKGVDAVRPNGGLPSLSPSLGGEKGDRREAGGRQAVARRRRTRARHRGMRRGGAYRVMRSSD